MGTPTITVVRNEVDTDCEYHCDALSALVPNALEIDYPAGERPALERTDGVVLSGSTAGVYEADEQPWIDDQKRLVRELIDREIPTLGVCFGHQLVNAALDGTVEHVGTIARPITATLADDRLFEDVSPVVPVAHGDVVTDVGDGMTVIASADYYHAFATRHHSAPLWTVQFHPEFTGTLRERLEADFGWTDGDTDLEDVDATRVVENFASIVADASV
ncbi:type 1 glutamine amidotransferase [Natronolimnohabitans sp. A-GB9]|uniref:type 1 glutamine amidotransferase n=1 Tax=Natronolimnohabitans sp. A-GB9 TaxID=3069757 RepID=UPI0027B1D457|nr:type 1 glutamine amidotransferase [Natronolimnohabitans sp. A-GB9]MDQ2050422.1 type 1 glutamine amidotransferase [Natronolimnohabitans sp. A-GB9]